MRICYRNACGSSLSLTEGGIRAVSLNGCSPYAAVNVEENTVFDGGSLISEHTGKRNILLKLACRGDFALARSVVTGIFRTKEAGELIFTLDNNAVRKISCRVERVNFPVDERGDLIQVSLICPQPFFYDGNETTVAMLDVIPLFKFPLALPANAAYKLASVNGNRVGILSNGGEIKAGAVFTICARGNAASPRLTNSRTFEYIEINTELTAGDILTIDTRDGSKSVTLERGGSRTDILGRLVWGSSFLQLYPGDNYIAVSAKSGIGNISVSGRFTALYGGI